MPSRGIPTTYPAPPLEWIASGLIGLRPAIPVPWSREIFSSSVISLTTIAARWSGDRLGFIQGCCLALDCAPAEGGSRMLADIRRSKKTYFASTVARRDMTQPPIMYKIVIVAGKCKLECAPEHSVAIASLCADAISDAGALHWIGENRAGPDQSHSRRLHRQRRQDHRFLRPRQGRRRRIDPVP